jgi:hypothetical protein
VCICALTFCLMPLSHPCASVATAGSDLVDYIDDSTPPDPASAEKRRRRRLRRKQRRAGAEGAEASVSSPIDSAAMYHQSLLSPSQPIVLPKRWQSRYTNFPLHCVKCFFLAYRLCFCSYLLLSVWLPVRVGSPIEYESQIDELGAVDPDISPAEQQQLKQQQKMMAAASASASAASASSSSAAALNPTSAAQQRMVKPPLRPRSLHFDKSKPSAAVRPSASSSSSSASASAAPSHAVGNEFDDPDFWSACAELDPASASASAASASLPPSTHLNAHLNPKSKSAPLSTSKQMLAAASAPPLRPASAEPLLPASAHARSARSFLASSSSSASAASSKAGVQTTLRLTANALSAAAPTSSSSSSAAALELTHTRQPQSPTDLVRLAHSHSHPLSSSAASSSSSGGGGGGGSELSIILESRESNKGGMSSLLRNSYGLKIHVSSFPTEYVRCFLTSERVEAGLMLRCVCDAGVVQRSVTMWWATAPRCNASINQNLVMQYVVVSLAPTP